ncbi:AMP-binding protein [Varunaivibrio sulfuroxidans]|uniref:Long-subunit acyl-CoA synthetase (AMP-forming) n=1 Tax=Varunaivibrio sulfuroxidans TaxID=1773489 RepID=A0A4V2UNU0_9PROT|nr:AMP-binding protein [Varunaivibrio sulfuroxidans]TCS63391.1 long-subunit acyl-CoA synthetase (AMP-forming) [Varunaivibrio sulfuroxidans]WES30462.1 AMP-binding protein [Varunaivibrio sulfuroxidans]
MHNAFDALAEHIRTRPDAVAVTDHLGDALTYAELGRRVQGLANALADAPPVLGVLMTNTVAWIVADLAVSLSGKTLVALPPFFSPGQLRHIIADAGVGRILHDAPLSDLANALVEGSSLQTRIAGPTRAPFVVDRRAIARSRRLIYTSGTTGTPKGVILGPEQIAVSVQALIGATASTQSARYLSVLPFALLLEQIAGIYAPLTVGARVHIAGTVAQQCAQGNSSAIIAESEAFRPTTTVLIPQILQAWVAALQHDVRRAPESLNFIAVGGAPVPNRLSRAAWAAGLPVYEGYGLSECCAVVCVNRPGARREGSVGRPLEGLDVTIEDGEITVEGPTVMEGYLHRPGAEGRIATGDLGHFDDDGFLYVEGRKDTVLSTSGGRNITPEWIEAAILTDTRIETAILCLSGDGAPGALLVAAPGGRVALAVMTAEELRHAVHRTLADIPHYAWPVHCRLVDRQTAIAQGWLSATGQPIRTAIAHNAAALFIAHSHMAL